VGAASPQFDGVTVIPGSRPANVAALQACEASVQGGGQVSRPGLVRPRRCVAPAQEARRPPSADAIRAAPQGCFKIWRRVSEGHASAHTW